MSDNAQTPPEGKEATAALVDFRLYYNVIAKRFWVVLLVVAVAMIGTFLYTINQPKLFRATASVVISRQIPQVLGRKFKPIVEYESGDWWSGTRYLKTQYRVIRSKDVALKTARRLSRGELWQLLGRSQKTNERPTEADYIRASRMIRGGIETEPVKDSRIVEVGYIHTDPKVAAFVANKIAETFIEENLVRRLASTQGASVWLDEQLETLRKQLNNAELAIHSFKERNKILSVSLKDRLSILSKTIQTLSGKRDESMTQRLALEAQMAQLSKIRKMEDPINDPALAYISNDVVRSLKQAYVTGYLKLVELRGRYMEKHPTIQSQEAVLAAIRKDLEREAMLQLQVLRAKHKTIIGTEGRYKTALDLTKEEGLELAKREIEFNKLSRTQAYTAKLYELVLGRLKETDLAKELKTNNIRMLDKAEAPGAPFKPQMHLNLALAFGVGLFLGVGLAFLLHYLDNTVKTQEDVEQTLKLPYLGLLPTLKYVPGAATEKKKRNVELYVVDNPKSSAAESCRSIRTNLLFMSPEKPLKSLLVTSAGPREGKTTVAINVAAVMAMAGEKTLLVDTDMRRPRLHQALGVANERGLTLAIVGKSELDDVIKATEVPNLFVIPRGPSTPNPAELLHSKKFKELTKRLAEKFDRIVFDSPPVGAVTDPVVLSRFVDGTILVVKTGVTVRELALKTLRQLRGVRANILGCILNDLDPERRSYGYYSSYYYYRRSKYYYYGEGRKG